MIKSMRTPIITIGIIIMILNLFGCSERTKQNNNKPSIQTPLTEQIIDTTSDNMLLEVVYDNLFRKLSAAYDKEYEIVLSWNKSRQAIYMISRLEAEVNNGGYNQFYFNSSGQFAAALPEALKLVGATKFADLTERANSTFVKEKSKITEAQDGTVEGFSKSYENNPLNKFDEEFYKLNDVENLQKIQVDYIRKNKKEFTD
ncbi:DMP19 family protein [Sphingobacterium siyangense]|uniref:DMP19 family protein n=1 Tax=Sphingobacterium siyangense TaxID=459529 RepID=UPI0031F72A93